MDILREIWDADEERMAVAHQTEPGGQPVGSADAPIVLHEYQGASQLIEQRQQDLFAAGSFAAAAPLFGMYKPIYNQPEDESDAKKQAIDTFLETCLATQPCRVLSDYLKAEHGHSGDRGDLKDRLWQVWFEPVTTYYGFLIAKATSPSTHTSGFEHVFAGEVTAKFGHKGNQETISGSVHGYHSWVKYALDQAAENVAYLGPAYGADETVAGLATPHVATVEMTWSLDDELPNRKFLAEKERGGFLVGTSPAAEIAMGAAAHAIVMARTPDRDETHYGKRRNSVVNSQIGGAEVGFVLYPNTGRDGLEGPRIRSFYPTLTQSD